VCLSLPLPFAFFSFVIPFFSVSCLYRSIHVKATASYSYNPIAGNHSAGRNVWRTHLEASSISLYIRVLCPTLFPFTCTLIPCDGRGIL
jgi:hypothetical protein